MTDGMQAGRSNSSARHSLFTDLKKIIRTGSFEYSLRSRYSAKTYTGLSHLRFISELSTLSRI